MVVSSSDATAIVDKSGMAITAMEFLHTLGGRPSCAAAGSAGPSNLCFYTLNRKPSLNDSSLTDGPRTTVVHK
jgi:hypothetical protein